MISALYSHRDTTAETRMVERIKAAIARQRGSKNMPTATDKHTTTEELLEAMFSMYSMPWPCSEVHG
jgi:hypothetical protein